MAKKIEWNAPQQSEWMEVDEFHCGDVVVCKNKDDTSHHQRLAVIGFGQVVFPSTGTFSTLPRQFVYRRLRPSETVKISEE